jgi:hypothetical protein
MASESILKALKASEEVKAMRAGQPMPPNYDIALCLYGRNNDGSDAEDMMLQFNRPQDFATNEHMKYQVFAVMHSHEKDGKEFMTVFLVHLYWDSSLSEDEVREEILNTNAFAYGFWEPTAPSDPLKEDDYWREALGEPPNGYLAEFEDEDNPPAFEPFDNFKRPPYPKVQLGKR